MTTANPITSIEIIPLQVSVQGAVLESNVVAFCDAISLSLARINRNLQTDEDFGIAKQNVAELEFAEKAIKTARDSILAQVAEVHRVMSQLDSAAKDVSQARLDLSKLVTARETKIKEELIAEAIARIAHPRRGTFEGAAKAAIKGKRSLEQIRLALQGVADDTNRVLAQNRELLKRCEEDHPWIVSDNMDRLDLELQDTSLLEQRLEARIEKRKLQEEVERAKAAARAEQEERLKVEAAALAARSATMAPPQSEQQLELAPAKPAPSLPPIEVAPLGRTMSDRELAERAQFIASVEACFAQVKLARKALVFECNVRPASAFAEETGTAWMTFKRS